MSSVESELIALLAHDLRSPLNNVLMATELLSDRELVDDASRAYWLGVVREAALAMNALVGDILEASRLQSGQVVLEQRLHPLRPLLQEAGRAHEPAAGHAGVSLVIGACAANLLLRIDRPAMVRVLGNLIDNALRFTPAGGHVVLDGRRNGEEIHIRVQDTGAGIRPEHLPYIFDRFWQAGHEMRGSAGLGLTIVKSVVELHGGRVTVASETGVGTCFELAFPRDDGAAFAGAG